MTTAKTSPQWDAIVSQKFKGETEEVKGDVKYIKKRLKKKGIHYSKK